MRDTIIEHLAHTLALMAAADAWEGDNEEDRALFPEGFRGAGAGEDWEYVLPESTPPEAVTKANAIVADFEKRNGRDLVTLGEEWDTSYSTGSGYGDTAEYEWSGDGAERFGHCLAMEALGSGVGLSDDTDASYMRPDVGLFEFYVWDFDLPTWLTQ